MSSSVLEASAALRKALSGFDAATLSGADCARIAEDLKRTGKACDGASLLAAARAVECKAHEQHGFNAGADWLATQSGITPGEAKRNLNTARKLGDKTKEALQGGLLSLDQAEEITNTESEAPGSEAELVDLAQRTNLTRLREEGRDRRVQAMDRSQLHERQRKARYFRHWRDELGMVCFKGALPPEVGVPFVTRVERQTFRLHKAAKQQPSPESWDAHAADAFVEMVSRPADDIKTRAWQAEIVIVCDLRAWRRGHTHPGEPCHILDGGPIPVELAKELAEDAFLSAVLHDGVDVGTIARFGRHIPANLRTALDIGDPPDFTGMKCVDCGKRHRLEIDHVDPVANGGATHIDNLQPRCWADHKAKTERDRKAGLLGPHAPRPPNTS